MNITAGLKKLDELGIYSVRGIDKDGNEFAEHRNCLMSDLKEILLAMQEPSEVADIYSRDCITKIVERLSELEDRYYALIPTSYSKLTTNNSTNKLKPLTDDNYCPECNHRSSANEHHIMCSKLSDDKPSECKPDYKTIYTQGHPEPSTIQIDRKVAYNWLVTMSDRMQTQDMDKHDQEMFHEIRRSLTGKEKL